MKNQIQTRHRILGFAMRKQGCEAFCAEISLDGYRTSKRQAPYFIAQSRIPKSRNDKTNKPNHKKESK